MKELKVILETAKQLRAAKTPFALATVVKIGGSSYRRPGARMLVDAEGNRWGTISGGCLEADVAERAKQLIVDGESRLIPFTLEDDDLVLGFGTGCNGIVHVLIESVNPDSEFNILDMLLDSLSSRQTNVMATVIDSGASTQYPVATHALYRTEQDPIGGDRLPTAFQALATELLTKERDGQPYVWENRLVALPDGSEIDVLFEVVRPPVQLLIFGEGHDVGPVCSLAGQMGWTTMIVGRKDTATLEERFPSADAYVFLMHPEDVGRHIAADARSAAVVMNHAYVRDREFLRELLPLGVPYVGMLGPSERTENMLAELRAEGRTVGESDIETVFGPVGLDIGTESPEEIALSIVAEIQSVLHKRGGGFLRDRRAPIHQERPGLDGI